MLIYLNTVDNKPLISTSAEKNSILMVLIHLLQERVKMLIDVCVKLIEKHLPKKFHKCILLLEAV